jgi:hypothetical protein
MPAGCPEKLSFEFLLWIWNFPNNTRPKILTMLETQQGKEVIRLRSQVEVKAFLTDIASCE